MSKAETGEVEEQRARMEQQEERLTRALELLTQRGPGPAGRRRRDWDALAAVIASFIGLMALAVSAYTAYVQREQLRAQAWPHLQLYSSNVDSTMGHSVANQGTGPASVIAMRVRVDGVPATTWGDVWTAVGYARGKGFITSTISHAVIPAGKDIAFARPADDDQSRAKFAELLLREKHSFGVTLCYCSVLDECWIASNEIAMNGWAITRDGCPITVDQRFVE
ncbi:MAG TPA: hypothetical protein VF516_23770 [Kofleriaceae bacterium]